MAETKKPQDLTDAIDDAARDAFGRSRTAASAMLVCVACAKAPEAFRDKRSEREWEISRLCQACQDQIFKEE